MTDLLRAYAGTVVLAGLIAGVWVAVVGVWLHRAVDAAVTFGGRA